jgi:hypothetical protein
MILKHLPSSPPAFFSPCRRASLISASLASAPLLQKNTRPGPGVADQPPRELALVGVAEEVADVDQLARLPLHRLHPVRMAMAQRAHRDARGEIEVALALVVPHLGAAAAHQGEGGARA